MVALDRVRCEALPMAGTKRGAAATVGAAYVGLLGALLAAGWLLTHPWERAVDPRDYDVVVWLAERRTAELDQLASAGSHLADTRPGVALVLAIGAAVGWWRRSWLPVVHHTVLVVGHLSVYVVVTALVPRDRPPVPILDPGLVPDHSYPSGHTGMAVVLYAGTAVLLAWAAPRLRPWVWALLLVPPVVAVSRLYQGAHHPSDVLAGLLYAAVWVAVVSRTLLGSPAVVDERDTVRVSRPRQSAT